MKFFRNGYLNDGCGGLLTLAVGLLLFISPMTAARTLIILGGVLMLVYGLAMLVGSLGESGMLRRADLSGAVVRVALGVFMVVSPTTVTRLATTLVGIYLLLDALIGFVGARETGRPTVLYILPLILGLMLVLNPLRMVLSVLQWSGIALMATGAVNLVTAKAMTRR